MLPFWIVIAVLGVVEGLTEFIPVSSTGHLILAAAFLGVQTRLNSKANAALFEVFIQAGANLSDSPTGTIESLEHLLDSIEDRLREREADLAQSRRQIVDLRINSSNLSSTRKNSLSQRNDNRKSLSLWTLQRTKLHREFVKMLLRKSAKHWKQSQIKVSAKRCGMAARMPY
jgi:septal ring factor EnvC (AmiA/AmiB activator)